MSDALLREARDVEINEAEIRATSVAVLTLQVPRRVLGRYVCVRPLE